MTGPDGENELEAFLARRSLLHRRFAEGDPSEPSAELDRIVLAKAREAIKRPGDMPVYRAPQWALPVGLAASVLLVFAVVLNFVHVTNQQSPAVAANQTAAAPQVSMISEARERSAESFAPTPPSPALADAKAEADAAPPAALAKRTSAPLARVDSAKTRDQSASIDARAEPSAPAAEARSKEDLAARTAQAKPAEGERIAGSVGALASSGTVVAPSDAATPGPASRPAEPAPSTGTAGASNYPPLASTTSPRQTAVDEAGRSDESKDTYTAANASPSPSVLEEASAVGGRHVRGGGIKRPAVPNAPAQVAKEKVKHPNPDQWLREIDVLRAAGRTDEADRELELFRRTYPDQASQSAAPEQRPPAQ